MSNGTPGSSFVSGTTSLASIGEGVCCASSGIASAVESTIQSMVVRVMILFIFFLRPSWQPRVNSVSDTKIFRVPLPVYLCHVKCRDSVGVLNFDGISRTIHFANVDSTNDPRHPV